jgi:hypothetical protein
VGTVRLPVTADDGTLRPVMIHKVYRVPNFMINIISAREMQMAYGQYYSAYYRCLHDSMCRMSIYTLNTYG